MAIDPGAATPLYQQVALDIRGKIMSGEMPVGTQLPPHRELAVSYGVSIMTINKALSGLVSEGVLHSRVGRGTFVAVRPAPSEGSPAREMLGFVLRDLSSPFFSLVAHAAQQRADALGYGLLFSSSSNRLDREEEQIRRFRDLGASGLIIVSMARTYRINEPIQALHDAGYPYVMVSYTEGDDVPWIGMDLDNAGYLATQHLLAMGRRRIGYIGDRIGSIMCELRGRGYRRALEQSGLPVDPALEFDYPFEGEWNDYRSGYAVGERIAGLADPPDAMFVFNDLGALGFQDALLDRGINVPDDIAVVGLDDIELAGRARVPLTTVRQPVDRIGALAVDYVLARLRGEQPPNRQILPPQLIVRRSSGAAAEESTEAVADNSTADELTGPQAIVAGHA
ncbi:MAG TPA: GntR family transcriptional regulator [Gemmatimonadaceae bacterium]|nr:GntR family transcriptional regulator [Gemmatimonadaceae bacterium]